jgi:hypothetical protein
LWTCTGAPRTRLRAFKDHQSSAEGQAVSNALIALSNHADCLVLVVDHLGKDPDAGLRGTSAKETNPLFILSTGETQKDVYAPRQLTVRKMRNGRSGVAVSFQMRNQTVTLDQTVEDEQGNKTIVSCAGETLVIEWDTELRSVSEDGNASGGSSKMSRQQRYALELLRKLILGPDGRALPPECGAVPGLRGVTLESWQKRLVYKTVIGGKSTKAAFSRLKNGLMDRGEIDVGHGLVWMPLNAD